MEDDKYFGVKLNPAHELALKSCFTPLHFARKAIKIRELQEVRAKEVLQHTFGDVIEVVSVCGDELKGLCNWKSELESSSSGGESWDGVVIPLEVSATTLYLALVALSEQKEATVATQGLESNFPRENNPEETTSSPPQTSGTRRGETSNGQTATPPSGLADKTNSQQAPLPQKRRREESPSQVRQRKSHKKDTAPSGSGIEVVETADSTGSVEQLIPASIRHPEMKRMIKEAVEERFKETGGPSKEVLNKQQAVSAGAGANIKRDRLVVDILKGLHKQQQIVQVGLPNAMRESSPDQKRNVEALQSEFKPVISPS